MCGILGVIKKRSICSSQFSRQLDSINYRGPDDAGIWFNESNTVGLGSRRLAIRDLSSEGHMPMISADARYVIVFNGEIYNFKDLNKELEKNGVSFRSNSDTETILHAYMQWGVKCVEKLEGMFAFVIFDNIEQQLFVARDRTGEKPVFFWKNPEGISIASELKQLLLDEGLKRQVNYLALRQYLDDGYTKSTVSFIKNVEKLPAAHYLLYSIPDDKLAIQRYWNVPDFQFNTLSESDLLSELDVILEKSVKQQLIADVPIGVLLSGGVDSSLITAYSAKLSHNRLKTFHISFDGFGKYNEADFAKKVADYFNTDHFELSGNDITYTMIDELLNYFDEPMADSSMLPTFLVSRLTRSTVTVALGGDGGDELFGGYSTYKSILRHNAGVGKIPSLLRNAIGQTAGILPVGLRGRNFMMNISGNAYQRFAANQLFDSIAIKKTFSKCWEHLDIIGSKPYVERNDDLVHDMTKYDFLNYLCEDILVKVDRASMAVSLEMRTPWLDKNIIEFAFGKVPSKYKATSKMTKILPKKLLAKKMSIPLDIGRKQGFSIPLNNWMADKWYKNVMNEINEFPDLINKDYCIGMLKNIRKGYTNSSKLFALVILSKWIKKYGISY